MFNNFFDILSSLLLHKYDHILSLGSDIGLFSHPEVYFFKCKLIVTSMSYWVFLRLLCLMTIC